MDFLYAILLMALPPRGDIPVRTLPLVIEPGTLSDLPSSGPYVLDRIEWGPR